MATQDTSQLKEKIILILKRRGPSLPVHIAKETGLSILFTSAFLSELLSDKRIKLSNMRVGSSPIYFIEGQEPRLENFSQHLNSKEKEALEILKEKKFLKDTEQQPAIRVALRAIKDFAIAFKKNDEIFWRYFTIPESEFQEKPKPLIKKITESLIKTQPEEISKELDIFEEKIPKPKKKTKKRAESSKANEKFFNKVKEFLKEKSIEMSGIEGFSKNDLTLRVKKQDKEHLLVAYNKKRIIESDIAKAYKKATELNLPYIILSLGEPSKKLSTFIDAIKGLSEIGKIE